MVESTDYQNKPQTKAQGQRSRRAVGSYLSGYKGSRLIIANMFLLLTLCFILPSVRAEEVPFEVPCNYDLVDSCGKCEYLPSKCVACRPGYATISEVSLDCKPLTLLLAGLISGGPTVYYGRAGSSSAFPQTDLYKPCNVAGNPSCTMCFDDYTICAGPVLPACDTGVLYYDHVTSAPTCLPNDATTALEYGPVQTGDTKYVTKCINQGCNGCKTEYSSCDGCRTDIPTLDMFDIAGTPNSCLLAIAEQTYNLESGYSLYGAGGKPGYSSCFSQECATCGADYNHCDICHSWALNINGWCYLQHVIPSTFIGQIASSTQLEPAGPCQKANCKYCQQQYGDAQPKCFMCYTKATGGYADYYPHPDTGECVLTEDLPLYWGADIANGYTDVCTVPFCQSCKSDTNKCEVCQSTSSTGKPFFLYDDILKCTTREAKDLVGYGPDPTNPLVYRRCPEGCYYCREDYRTCETTALDSAGCDSQVTGCLVCLKAALPPGRRLLTVSPPTSPTCASCIFDHTYTKQYVVIDAFDVCVSKLTGSSPKGIMREANRDFIAQCLDPSCQDCSNDFTVCVECLPEYVLVDGRCRYGLPTIRLGPSDSGLVACSRKNCPACTAWYDTCDTPCNDPNCSKCDADPDICTACKLVSDPTKQTYLYESKCVGQASFPKKTGIVPGTFTIALCGDQVTCTSCKTDNTKCDVCITDTYGQPIIFLNGKCTNPADGTGLIKGGTTIGPCPTNCKRCNLDNTICTRCDIDNKWYLGMDSKDVPECQSVKTKPYIPAYYGINPTLYTVEPCKSGCLHCVDDTSKCGLCDDTGATTKFYLYDDKKGLTECQTKGGLKAADGTTVLNNDFPEGMGPDSTDSLVKLCKVQNCLTCSDNYAVCTACKAGFYQQLNSEDAIIGCYATGSFPDKYGIDLSAEVLTIDACTVVSCLVCTNDNEGCTSCTSPKLADLTAKTCIDTTTFEAQPKYGYVESSNSGKVDKCTDANCDDCRNKNTECKTCTSPYLLSLVDKKCYTTANTGSGVVIPTDGSSPININACVNPLCEECKDDNTMCTSCKGTNLWDSANKKCYSTAPDGYGLKAPGSGSYEIIACDATKFCTTCPDSYEVCTGCKIGYYFDTTSKACYDIDHIPEGLGVNTADPADNVLKACNDATTCVRCPKDHMKCSVCLNALVLYVNKGTCHTFEEVLASTGKIVLATGQSLNAVADCATSGCIECTADYEVCDKCDPTKYSDTVGKTCPSTIPAGFGTLKSSSNPMEIMKCTDTNCELCAADNTKCTQCKTSFILDVDVCVATAPPGRGEDKDQLPLRTLVDCIGNCHLCAANYQECTDCNGDYYLYDKKCYIKTTPFPAKTGIVLNSSPRSLGVCADAGCILCSDDNSNCDQCDVGLYLDSANKQCVTSITQGYGLLKTDVAKPNEIVKCNNEDCILCDTNHLECHKCAKDIFFDKMGKTCKKTIEDGMGKDVSDTTLNTILACEDSSFCAKCADDYTVCQKCKDSLYLELIGDSCVVKGGISKGFGIDTSASVLTVKPCADTNCDLCTDNYQICTQCNDKSLLSPKLNKCFIIGEPMPDRYGKDQTPDDHTILIPCSDSKCEKCFEDNEVCTLCDKGFSLDKDGTCHKISTRPPTPVLPIPAFDKKPNTYAFAFPGKKITQNLLYYFLASLVTSDEEIINDQSNFEFHTEKDGFSVTINTDKDFGKANLVIDRAYTIEIPPTRRILAPALTDEEKATLDSMPFPFQGTVISNLKSGGINAIRSFEVYTKIGIALRIISNILLPFDSSSRAAAFGIDKAFSHLSLASVQSSEQYILSRMALKLVKIKRRTVLPFLEFDSLEDDRARQECNPSNAMLVSGVDCDFFVNYGDNAIGLTIILAFMIILDLAYFFMYGKSASQTSPAGKSFSFFVYITLKTFGLRFFLAKMDGVMMETVFYSFINVYSLNTKNVGGFIISLIFLTYCLLQIGLCARVVRQLVTVVGQDKRTTIDTEMDVVDLYEATNSTTSSALWRVSSMIWTGIRTDLGSQAVYYPIVSMIRMFLLGLIVGLLTDLTVTTAFLVILLEIGFILYSFAATRLCPRISALDNILEFIGPFFNIIYYIFSVFSNIRSAKDRDSYDTYLLVLLSIFILAYLLLVTISIVKSFVKFVKWMRSDERPQKKYETTEANLGSPEQYLQTHPAERAAANINPEGIDSYVNNMNSAKKASNAIEMADEGESPYIQQSDYNHVYVNRE